MPMGMGRVLPVECAGGGIEPTVSWLESGGGTLLPGHVTVHAAIPGGDMHIHTF